MNSSDSLRADADRQISRAGKSNTDVSFALRAFATRQRLLRRPLPCSPDMAAGSREPNASRICVSVVNIPESQQGRQTGRGFAGPPSGPKYTPRCCCNGGRGAKKALQMQGSSAATARSAGRRSGMFFWSYINTQLTDGVAISCLLAAPPNSGIDDEANEAVRTAAGESLREREWGSPGFGVSRNNGVPFGYRRRDIGILGYAISQVAHRGADARGSLLIDNRIRPNTISLGFPNIRRWGGGCICPSASPAPEIPFTIRAPG